MTDIDWNKAPEGCPSCSTTTTGGRVMRRRQFKNEIWVDVSNAEHMALLAEMLEIQADGGEANFVAYTLSCFERELRARFHERKALELRQEQDDE